MTTRTNLAELEALGLIHLAVASEEAAYIFRHALIQDAAYASLVKQDRQHLNLIVGETLERLYADRVEQIAPRLAQHFKEAGDDRRALKYYTLAGDRTVQQFANAEASTHYTRALNIAKRAADLENASSILKHLYLQRGQALHSIADYQGALENYLDMRQFAQARGDRSLELHSLIEQAEMYAVFGPLLNPARSIELGQQALTLNEQVHDRAAEARVDWVLMRALAQTGLDPQQAIRYGERSIALARELNLSDQLAYSLNDINYAYRSNLMVRPALEALAEARHHWRAIGQQHMLADNLNQAALIHFYLGNFEEAEQLIGESLSISAATDNVIQFTLCHFVRMLINYERGYFNDAFDSSETALQNFNPILTGIKITKAFIVMELGSLELATQEVQTAQDILHQTNLTPIFGGAVYGLQIRLAIRRNDLGFAHQMLERAQRLPGYGANVNEFLGTEQLYISEIELALAEQQIDLAQTKCDKFSGLAEALGARRLLPSFLRLRAQIYRTHGEIDRAADSLQEARSIAQAIGARTSLLNVLIDLIEIERQRGRDASQLIDQARDLSGFLIDHCPDQLRATYAAKIKSISTAW